MSKHLVIKTTALATDTIPARFEMVGFDYIEAPGPGEAIISAVGAEGAFSSEYRAYPVEGSAVLGVDLRITGIEESGQRAVPPTPENAEEAQSV